MGTRDSIHFAAGLLGGAFIAFVVLFGLLFITDQSCLLGLFPKIAEQLVDYSI